MSDHNGRNEAGKPGGKMSGSFYSRGKLLLTGEYLVLRGAVGLALPVQMGQKMEWRHKGHDREKVQGGDNAEQIITANMHNSSDRLLEWVTLVKGEKWFEAVFSGSGYKVVSSSDRVKAVFLANILVRAAGLSSNPPVYGRVDSSVEFDMEWGLGSSSSLISNVAYLFDVNPFALHFAVSRGSGYDIACARSGSPLLYRLEFQTDKYHSEKVTYDTPDSFPVPVYREVSFRPPFIDSIFFAYTGKKQDSARSVSGFLAGKKTGQKELQEITGITEGLLAVSDLNTFNEMLREHDMILSRILGEKPPKDTIFKDLPGYVKSLGAWGGDFLMISWDKGIVELMNALKQKGIDVVFPYNNLIYDGR